MLVDARDWHWVSSSINGVPVYLLRQGLSQNLELVQLAILASQLALGFLSLLSTGYQMGYYSCLHFEDGARYKTLVLMLCRSTPSLHPLSRLPVSLYFDLFRWYLLFLLVLQI